MRRVLPTLILLSALGCMEDYDVEEVAPTSILKRKPATTTTITNTITMMTIRMPRSTPALKTDHPATPTEPVRGITARDGSSTSPGRHPSSGASS